MKNRMLTLIRNPRQVFRYIFYDTHDYQNTLFLAGSARSGTTWLQEIINFDNAYRVMFEPFDPKRVEVVQEWNEFQYLRVDEDSPLFVKPLNDILCGDIRNYWIDTHNKRLFSNKRLIKAIHANLFLLWIKTHFPEIPIILIMRHPCAVANSKINIAEKHFRYTDSPLEHFLIQTELAEDYLAPYEKLIRKSKTIFETNVFMWCIENFVPMKQFNKGEIHVTFYENLCVNPENEIKNIFSYIGKPYSPAVLHQVKTPSRQSKKHSAIVSGNDLIRSWRKNITHDQIQRAVEILDLFGMDVIYNDNDLPLLEGNQALEIFERTVS